MPAAISLAGGAALGLASSLHCLGMCGGISLMLGGTAAGNQQALLHGGRILSYAGLGALAGGLGSAAMGGVDPGTGHALLRWSAALSLGWMGLVTAGLAPAPAFLGHAAPRAIRALLRLPLPARRIAGGLAWGLLPCGMVYGALLFAMFAGSALGGALVMLGFGLGTLPALVAAGLGFGRLQAMVRARWLGAAMVGIAALSLIDNPAALGAWCARLANPLTS